MENAAVDGTCFLCDVGLFSAMLEFALEGGELSLDFGNVEVGATFFERLGGGSAEAGDVEGLVQIFAGTEAEGLPSGVEGLERGEHDDFDAFVDLLELAEDIDAGHSLHEDVEDRDVDGVLFGDADGFAPVGSDEDLEVATEDDFERSSRPFFVIDDEEGWFAVHGARIFGRGRG